MSGLGNRKPGRPATAQDIANLSAARGGQALSAGWTDEQVARLRTLWNEGHSTAEIGRRLSFSKNSICGKVHRLHLPSRPSHIVRSADPAHVKRRDQVKHAPIVTLAVAAPAPVQVVQIQVVPDAPAIDSSATVFRSPRLGCCTWPMWDNRERPTHVYCDAPATGKLRWCPSHRAQGTRQVRYAA